MIKYPDSACDAHRNVKTSEPVCVVCMSNEIDRLRRLLDEAADSIANWGAYASEYFQDKHDLAGDIKRFRAEGMK